jgi:hypothetical protein
VSLPLFLLVVLVSATIFVGFSSGRATDEDREWLTSRFLVTMAGTPEWWVRERYGGNAAALGTVDAIPALVTLALQKGDASVERTREAAIGAVAAITGWDPRVDPSTAKPRSPEDVARAIARECSL